MHADSPQKYIWTWIYTYTYTHMHVHTLLVSTWDMTHAYVRHDTCIFANTYLNGDLPYTPRHDSFTCDDTYSCVWHEYDSCICATWQIHKNDELKIIICATWHIHMCHDPFICEWTWLNHAKKKTDATTGTTWWWLGGWSDTGILNDRAFLGYIW